MMETGQGGDGAVLSWLAALRLVEPAPGEPLLLQVRPIPLLAWTVSSVRAQAVSSSSLQVELGQVSAVDPRLAQLLLEDAGRAQGRLRRQAAGWARRGSCG